MQEELEKRIEALEKENQELQDWKKSLERSSSIPLQIDQSFRERFREYRLLFGQALLNFSSVAAAAAGTLTINVAGARINDPCLVSPQAALASSTARFFQAYCVTEGVVTIQFDNQTAGAIDLDPITFRVVVFQKLEKGKEIK